MIEGTTPDGLQVRGALIGIPVWNDAVERIVGGTVPTDDPDQLLAWRAAGIINEAGALDPQWSAAITIANTATTAIQLMSSYQGMVFDATVIVSWARRTAVSLTKRSTYVTNEEGKSVIDESDPMMEVALAPSDDAWALIQRVLPPLDLARATPVLVPAGELCLINYANIAIPPEYMKSHRHLATHLADIPTLPPEMRATVQADAEVFTFTVSADTGQTRTAEQIWAVAEKLYRIDPSNSTLAEVPSGDIGGQLVNGVRTLSGQPAQPITDKE